MGDDKRGRIGILGGSFDPVHLGHINLARCAMEEFALDAVWLVPAGHSPNKSEDGMAPASERAAMISLAIEGIPGLALSLIEIEEEGTSYTYRTLTRLCDLYPDADFFFIMGADSLDYFDSWAHPEVICEKAAILVAERGGLGIPQVREKIERVKGLFPARIYPLRGGRMDISSSEIRRQLGESEERPPLLPEPVWRHILKMGLYGTKDGGGAVMQRPQDGRQSHER